MVSDLLQILKQGCHCILLIVLNIKRDYCFAFAKVKYGRHICQGSHSLWGLKGKSESHKISGSKLWRTNIDADWENSQKNKNLPYPHTYTCERIHSKLYSTTEPVSSSKGMYSSSFWLWTLERVWGLRSNGSIVAISGRRDGK